MAPQVISKPSPLEEKVLADLPPHWLHGDDRCDCPIQRIGEWTNPYLGKTVQIRLCCVWGELAKVFPEFVQVVEAFYDSNTDSWVQGQQPWDSEDSDMPLYLWYRQVSAQTGQPLEVVRNEVDTKHRPRKVPRGTGRESRQVSAAQVKSAHESRLRQTGWC